MKNTITHFLQKYALEGLIEWVDLVFILLEVIVILIIAWVVSHLIRKIISGVERQLGDRATGDELKRIQTLSRVLRYISSVIIFAITIMLVLSGFGISIAPLLGAAGVAGVAIGFGAQSLVKDYFTGFVMLLENQIRQGDIVEVAGKSGTVEEVTLRYIRLRDYEGIVHFIPNSVISVVTNRSRTFAYSVMEIGVSYNESYERVVQVLRDVATEMQQDPELKDRILADLEIAGLDSFGESSVNIRCRMMVQAQYQFPIKREFLARTKMAFDRERIEIPFRQVVIHQKV